MPDELEPTWRALANPIRREMLDRLREGPLPTGELVLAFPDLSRFAVMQHLGVLEQGGLVVTQKLGRVRMNCLNVVPLRQIFERWMSRYESLWADELIDLKRMLEDGTSRLSRTSSQKPVRRSASRLDLVPTQRKSRTSSRSPVRASSRSKPHA